MPERSNDQDKRLDKPLDVKPESPESLSTAMRQTERPEPALEPARVTERMAGDEVRIQDTLKQLGHHPNGGTQAPPEEPRKFTTAEVKTREQYRDTIAAYDKIFTDPTDKEPPTTLARFFFSPELARYYQFKNDADETIGMQLHRINPHVPEAGYTPYGGLLTDYKSLNIYPKMAKIADEQMRTLGVKFIMNDCEDPARILNVAAEAYPGEDPAEVVARCERRLNFFRRSMDQMYVNDPNIPYMRPASDDPKNPDPEKSIQAYDLLGFRALDPNDPMWKDAFNEDKTMLKKEVYGDMYLKLMQLEFGDKNGVPTKEDLRRGYPAIDQFFKNFDSYQGEWVTLLSDQVREKATPNTGASIEPSSPNVIDERARWQHVPQNGPGWERPLTAPPERERGPEPTLTPLTLEDMKQAVPIIAREFGTDVDPTQAPPSVEQFQGLQRIDPYSLLLRKNDKGQITGWSAIVPVSKELADGFAAGKVNEAQIIKAAIENPKYDALYHWAFKSMPGAEGKGEAIALAEAQFKKLIERHPTIRDHVAWGYSEEGAQFMHRMEQDLGIRIRKSPGSF